MADLAQCMDELGAALKVIDGLRAYPYYSDKVTPPAAVVAWPDEYTFDSTMQRGSDRTVMPVTVVVGRSDARSSRDRLALYVTGSGDQSVKQAIEDHQTTVWSSARVQKVEFDVVSIAGISYLAATFDVELLIPGKAV